MVGSGRNLRRAEFTTKPFIKRLSIVIQQRGLPITGKLINVAEREIARARDDVSTIGSGAQNCLLARLTWVMDTRSLFAAASLNDRAKSFAVAHKNLHTHSHTICMKIIDFNPCLIYSPSLLLLGPEELSFWTVRRRPVLNIYRFQLVPPGARDHIDFRTSAPLSQPSPYKSHT